MAIFEVKTSLNYKCRLQVFFFSIVNFLFAKYKCSFLIFDRLFWIYLMIIIFWMTRALETGGHLNKLLITWSRNRPRNFQVIIHVKSSFSDILIGFLSFFLDSPFSFLHFQSRILINPRCFIFRHIPRLIRASIITKH